jgi:hypothetical protein
LEARKSREVVGMISVRWYLIEIPRYWYCHSGEGEGEGELGVDWRNGEALMSCKEILASADG